MTAYWNELGHHTDLAPIWMAHPDVRAAINRRVTADASQWPLAALKRWLGARMPIGKVVSVGCGVGGLERSLISEGIARDVTGIDASPAAIEEARALAGSAITYAVADARQFLASHAGEFDAVFFHQSLHHFDRLDDLMTVVRHALKPGGFLYADEYVGPSRDEWRWWRLLIPNLAYYSVPAAARRPHLVRAPINRDDPTEAVRSSEIVASIARHFRIVHKRDYGGNILAVVYPNLRRPSEGAPPDAFGRAVRRLIAIEERLLRLGAGSFYTTMIAQ
ncbi:MAG TPA: class I SAM-dependent methyltransferase [Thermoanaerobaculia bacterium]